MILNGFFEAFHNNCHISKYLLWVFIFFPKLFEIGKELILSLNEFEKEIKVVLANGSEIRSVARYELDHEFVNRVNFLKVLALLIWIPEGLDKLIAQSKSDWDANVDVDFHSIEDLSAKLTVWHSLVRDQIGSAENDLDVLPQKWVVIFFYDLQTDVDDVLQLLTTHVIKTSIWKQDVSELTSIERLVKRLSVAESIAFKNWLKQRYGILEDWMIHFRIVKFFSSSCVKLSVFLVKKRNEVILEVVVFFGWMWDVRQGYDFSFVERRVELEDLADLCKRLAEVFGLALSKD